MKDLSHGALFMSYIKALSPKQLRALHVWQDERLADNPDNETVADALAKKKAIYDERRRRG